MSDPFANWTYGDWANLKLFDDRGDIPTPYPDLNETEVVFTVSPIDEDEEEKSE